MDAKTSLFLTALLGLTCAIGLQSCKSAHISRVKDATENRPSYCSLKASKGVTSTYIEEDGARCKVAPVCQKTNSDPDGDGWGWENEESCRYDSDATSKRTPTQTKPGELIAFDTTYYPYGLESYFKTTCGDAQDHGGMYFAVTEDSPLWPHKCDLDSWAECADSDCLGKWDRLPYDVRKEVNGKRMVREPRCDVPCGQKFKISNADKTITTTAVIYDACPSQHWNNRYKEVNLGTNPCAAGLKHLDLRKPLYIHLNGGKISDNIKVWVDPTPLD